MQELEGKDLQLAKELGKLIAELREKRGGLSLNQLANGYDLNKGTLSKLENGIVNCKFITLWKISEALGLKLSDFIKILEKKLGKDFKLIDE